MKEFVKQQQELSKEVLFDRARHRGELRSCSSVNSKSDLRSGISSDFRTTRKTFNLQITAFRTRYGHYEFQVMPFGLTNANSVGFMDFDESRVQAVSDQFVMYSYDDIS
ncbi:hypothetical protein Tco_1301435 [Tanacetum coccineum]